MPVSEKASGLCGALAFLAAFLGSLSTARSEDRVDMSTTWYQEQRRGDQGGLTVVHPQLDIGLDVGEHTSLELGYSADAVSGATAAVYSVDATSSATPFEDTRHVASGGLRLAGSRSTLQVGASVGRERDYLSIALSASAKVYLPGKNTQLALSYSHGFDEVCDFDNGMATALERRPLTAQEPCQKRRFVLGKDSPGKSVWRELSIDSTQATLTQNLSPTLVAQLALFGQVLRGFQSNPYRRVRVSGVDAQEALPDIRGRLALMVRANKYLPKIEGAVHGMIRGYSDTWGLNSITLGLGYSQYFGESLLLRLNGRIYQQEEARFFKDAFFYETEGPAGEFFAGDRELGSIRNIVGGAKLTYIKHDASGGSVWGVFDEISFNLKADLYLLDELPSDPIDDNPEGIDRQYLNGGQLLDAFVLQTGILMRY